MTSAFSWQNSISFRSVSIFISYNQSPEHLSPCETETLLTKQLIFLTSLPHPPTTTLASTILLHSIPCCSPGKNTGVGCHFLLLCMKVKSDSEVTQSCQTLSNPIDWSLPGFSRQEYWSGVPLPSPSSPMNLSQLLEPHISRIQQYLFHLDWLMLINKLLISQ